MNPWQPFSTQPDLLGESPFWHPQEQALYWVDIVARQIRRALPQQPVQSWGLPMEPGCIAPARGGGLVVALRDGIYRARRWGGPLTLLAPFGHDIQTLRFNDGKADPLGRFWAATLYEPRTARQARLYSIDCRPDNGNGGQPIIEQKAQDAVVGNGLAWSPDARTVYWADTTHHVVHAWDWDCRSNAMGQHRVFQQFPGKPAHWQPGQPGYGGRPDGAAVDAQGNYWCAMYEGGRLLKFGPAGQLLADIAVPMRCPTMPCFGGPDLKTLFLTSASHRRDTQELQAFPASGCVLSMAVEVPGLPVNFFID